MRFFIDVALITGILFVGTEALRKHNTESEPPVAEMVFTTEVQSPIDNSSEIKAAVSAIRNDLGNFATVQQLGDVQKNLVDKVDVLNTELSKTNNYVKQIPTECPKPEIPKELQDSIEELKARIDKLENISRDKKIRQQSATPKNRVQEVIAQAREEGKSILFYYDQDNCSWCPQFIEEVIKSSYVQSNLRNDVLFYHINKDHLNPGEDFSVPPAVPAVQLLLVSETGVRNTNIPIPVPERTPERFVALVRAQL